MTDYPPSIYQTQNEGVRRSAELIVPMVMELVSPKRVIDVGCGLGTWLAVFRQRGIEEVVGVDGPQVDVGSLEIPRDCFLRFDLTSPLRLEERFDLAVSLEVAEHLPPESADTFVESLTRLAPVVLFSAAIPLQGGWHHINEQWPDYWAEKFSTRGFAVVDHLRPLIWLDQRVQRYYRQNLLLFVNGDLVSNGAVRGVEPATPLRLVHPEYFLEMAQRYQDSVEEVWRLRSELVAREIRQLIPSGEALILVDQDQLGREVTQGYKVVRFPERDGEYWGPPADDATATAELLRLEESGSRFVVLAWPAFWWMEHYQGFSNHLNSEYRRLTANEHLIVFEMGSGTGS